MPKGSVLTIVRTIGVLGDLALINFGIILAFLVRFEGIIPAENWPAYVTTAPWITLLALILFKIYGLYDTKGKDWPEVFLSLFCALLVTFVGIMAISFLFRGFAFPRTVIFIAPFSQLLLLGIWRYLLLKLIKKISGYKKVIILGNLEEACNLATKVSQYSKDLELIGFVLEDKFSSTKSSYPILGEYSHLNKILKDKPCDLVLLCPSLSKEEKASFTNMALFNGKEVSIIPDLYELILAQAKLEQIGDTPIFSVSNFQINENYRLIKRLMDISFASFGLLLMWPIMTFVALLIKLDSKGPVFYSQERVSENGKVFRLHKFRTMVVDAEKTSGPILATTNDPRITSIGKLLRGSRLDELPQLINILKGEMSLVGPRPERPFFVEQFNKEYQGYIYRQRVKSGLTGLAQVAGKYSTTPQDKLRYDLLYVKTNSLSSDLKILLQTLKVVLMKDKSA